MHVIRTQWPVGQGCFATGQIQCEGTGRTAHYVYDCGARSIRHLEPIIAAYTRRVSLVDALFVSHLDGDHVDGLDLLLARANVETVYLPYMSPAQRLLLLAQAESLDKRLTGSFLQAHFAPSNWFGSRGVENVVLVRNDGEAPEATPSPPPEGSDEDGGPSLIDKTKAKLISESANEADILEMHVGGYLAAPSTRYALNWVLQPYVPKVDDGRVKLFEDRIRAKLGLTPLDAIDFDLVKDLLKSDEGRKSIRTCYDAILADGSGAKHNEVSMSLYSGPIGEEAPWSVTQVSGRFLYWHHSATVPGWLGTGDAKLKNGKNRREWKDFYRSVTASICSLLLPHHGSRRNFHSELLSFPKLKTCIASADEMHEGYRHPSAEVVDEIEEAGIYLAHVTKRLPTKFVEEISLL